MVDDSCRKHLVRVYASVVQQWLLLPLREMEWTRNCLASYTLLWSRKNPLTRYCLLVSSRIVF